MDTIPPPRRTSRPVLITILCVLGFLGAAAVLPLAFSEAARAIGPWYPPYLVLSGAVGLLCNIGFWRMKRWAVFAYIGFVAINQVIMLSAGIWSFRALIVPAVFIAIVACYQKRMT